MRMSGVAQRIEDAVIRGEIDNTVEGKTTGWLWMLGRAEPIELDLTGDCWRDLAGARLKFRNPHPEEADFRLAPVQTGVVGDMTASQKHRVAMCDAEEFVVRQAAGDDIPVVWKNTLFLEWFSELNGRVVIDAIGFELELSEPVWLMDSDAEEAQKMANMQAMRDYLEGIIARRPPEKGRKRKEDEFEWEQRLRESDRLSDAYQEVIEKYLGDPDAERKGAFVMGWDSLLGAMSESKSEIEEAFSEDDPNWQEDEPDDDLDAPHPLQQEAEDLTVRGCSLFHKEDDEPGCEDAAMVIHRMAGVAAKLAAALNGNYERETGYVLAILKRCLSYQNEAIAACGRLLGAAGDSDEERAIEAYRDEIFEQRERLTNYRQKLKKS